MMKLYQVTTSLRNPRVSRGVGSLHDKNCPLSALFLFLVLFSVIL